MLTAAHILPRQEGVEGRGDIRMVICLYLSTYIGPTQFPRTKLNTFVSTVMISSEISLK